MKAFELKRAIGIDGFEFNPARPDPEATGTQVLIRVRAASLNYRDLGVARGAYGYSKFPVIPLSDGAGEVVAVGPEVTQFKVGDRVAGTFFQAWLSGRVPANASQRALGGNIDGMLAEYVALPQDGVIHIPDHLSFEEASTLPCAALTAWHSLVERGNLKAGDTVAVLGTGGVSCFALQFAKLHGARVIATSSSNEKLDRAKSLGANDLINYKSTPDWDHEMLRITDNIGIDHVIEVGGAGTVEKSLNALRPGGSVYMIGSLSGAGTVNPRSITRKGARVHGINVGSKEMFANMNKAISFAKLHPIIDRVFSFAEAKEAFHYQSSGKQFSKVTIAVN